MTERSRKTVESYGVRVLLAGHSNVRRLKRKTMPTRHGNRPWSSSWLLMDYLAKAGLASGARVLDVGCGWGLAGIFCAKRFQASVTGVDADPDVFPFLQLHAQVNGVEIHTLRREFTRVTTETLRGFDLLIGTDICFWDELVRPLRNLVLRALRAGVRGALIADPGRPPFEAVGEHFVDARKGEVLDWEVKEPRAIRGQILRVGSAPRLP